MTTSTVPDRLATVAHAFADLMNGHDPDAVDGFVAEDYINHNAFHGHLAGRRRHGGEHWDQLDGQAFFAQLAGAVDEACGQ